MIDANSMTELYELLRHTMAGSKHLARCTISQHTCDRMDAVDFNLYEPENNTKISFEFRYNMSSRLLIKYLDIIRRVSTGDLNYVSARRELKTVLNTEYGESVKRTIGKYS